MKKKYTSPELQVELFNDSDIIYASWVDDGSGNDFGDDGEENLGGD